MDAVRSRRGPPGRPAQPERSLRAAQVDAQHPPERAGREHLLRRDPAPAHLRHAPGELAIARGRTIEQPLQRVEPASGRVRRAELLVRREALVVLARIGLQRVVHVGRSPLQRRAASARPATRADCSAQPQPTPHSGSAASAESPTNASPGRVWPRTRFGISSLPITFDSRLAGSRRGPSGRRLEQPHHRLLGIALNSGMRSLWGMHASSVRPPSVGNRVGHVRIEHPQLRAAPRHQRRVPVVGEVAEAVVRLRLRRLPGQLRHAPTRARRRRPRACRAARARCRRARARSRRSPARPRIGGAAPRRAAASVTVWPSIRSTPSVSAASSRSIGSNVSRRMFHAGCSRIGAGAHSCA